MKHQFTKRNDQGIMIVAELSEELGNGWDEAKAAKILKAVLNAIRNRLDVEASVSLLRILPTSLKAVYVDGWELKNTDEKHKGDFVEEVKEVAGSSTSFQNFLAKNDLKQVVESVLRLIRRYARPDKNENVLWLFPHEMDYILEEEEPLFI